MALGQITAQIAPKGQARIGPGGMGKKTTLATAAVTRMAAVAMVKMVSLRMALFRYVRFPGGSGCAGPGQQFSGKRFAWAKPNSSIVARFFHRVSRPSRNSLMCLIAHAGCFIDGRLAVFPAEPGESLRANAGAAGGRWLHQDERRVPSDPHSARRTGYRAGAKCSAGSNSNGLHCYEDC